MNQLASLKQIYIYSLADSIDDDVLKANYINMCPKCRQTQAFCSQTSGTDVELSRSGRRSVRAPEGTPPQGGGVGLVLPRTFVFCVIPSHPTIFKPSQLHIHSNPLVFVLNNTSTFLVYIFSSLFLMTCKTGQI